MKKIILALAVALALGLPTEASQTATLKGTTGSSCTFTGSITVKPDGSVEVPCTTGTTTPPPVVTPPPPVVTPPPPTTPVSCPVVPGTPVPQNIDAAFGSGTTLRMLSGKTNVFILPTPKFGKVSGVFWISAGTSTWPLPPYYFEVHISKCKGLIQPSTTDACYGKHGTKNGTWSLDWHSAVVPGTTMDTPEKIKAAGRCWAPASEGPWYINIRYTYAGCEAPGGGACGWNYQWKNGSL